MEPSLTHLRIFFRDEDMPELLLPIPRYGPDGFHSLGSEQAVTLPNGEKIEVYAEVSLERSVPDILISVVQNDRNLDVRCGSGVIVSYETEGHLDVLLQIGTGAWDE